MLDDALDILQRGGALMWPLLAVSVTAVALACERAYVLWFQFRLDLDQFVDHLVDLLEGDDYSRALEVCGTYERHPFATIAKAGLMKANGSEREIQRAMEAAAVRQVPVITRRGDALPTLANVATLIGLLGTVVGLIQAFSGMSEADSAAKQEILSRGIAVAMSTTAVGLCTAIIAVLAGAAVQARATRILAHVESKSTELLSHLVVRGRLTAKRAG